MSCATRLLSFLGCHWNVQSGQSVAVPWYCRSSARIADAVSGVLRGEGLALVVAGGGKEVGTGGGSVGGLGEHGLEWGLPQKEQDGGCFSLGVTGGSIDQQCRTDVCAPKYACDSFNLTTSVESGFLFDTVSGVLKGRGLGPCG
ncbi:unnamed protein product [Ectocarpus sp. CCAP 1310/34]|nr:unnamed protein product [Ectocarpus sp. CCAP 1310/34]